MIPETKLNPDDRRLAAAFDHAVELLPEPRRSAVAEAAVTCGLSHAFVEMANGGLGIELSVLVDAGFERVMTIIDARDVGYALNDDGQVMYVG